MSESTPPTASMAASRRFRHSAPDASLHAESPTVLSSPRLRYQRLSRNDTEAFHTLCLDEHFARYLLDGVKVTRRWVVESVELSDRLFRTDGVGLWLVWHNATLVGFCGFRVFRELGAEPQLLYGFTGDHVGAGYATEVAETMVAETRRLGWSRVVAAVDRPNGASVRVLEKAGFTACGRVPGAFGHTLLFERFETPPPPRLSSTFGTAWTLKIERTWDGERVGADEAVAVAIELGETELLLQVDAPFYDDPPPDSDDLWAYEVVELMLVGAGDTYVEVELSPHGHYLVLFLRGERNVVHRGVVLDYRADIEGSRWRGVAHLPIGWLPLETNRLNAFAMHGARRKRRYLAWRPTGGQHPDFHRLAKFGAFGDDSIDRSSSPS